jgi:predicted DNA-binding ribbon-helix-helix protein
MVLKVVKRSVSIAGHATSISLEEPFWLGLRALAALRAVPLARLIADIDAARDGGNLSSALRVHVLAAAMSGELADDVTLGAAGEAQDAEAAVSSAARGGETKAREPG